ncbi:MAG: amidase, partial [Hyphomicrobiales bacterium]|nr:amidase [Hyphomicrobiales bacterium]
MGSSNETSFYGPVKNPWNADCVPGGSSGGSAAAVAAGMVPFAIGSQTGGSIIRPAAFCGVAGFKPSFRMIPTIGMKAFSWTLDTVGFFAPSVAAVAFFTAAITGRDLAVETESRPPRIGIVHTHVWHEATGEMRAAVERGARLAADAGAEIAEIELAGQFSEAFAAHQIIQDHQAAIALAYELDNHRDQLSLILRDTLDYGRTISVIDYDTARRTARATRLLLRDAFQEVDVLLTPSAPGPAPEGLGSTGSSIFNRLWTLMGVPTVNVPGLQAANGLPLGLQIVGPHGRDRETLAAAAWFETVLKGSV